MRSGPQRSLSIHNGPYRLSSNPARAVQPKWQKGCIRSRGPARCGKHPASRNDMDAVSSDDRNGNGLPARINTSARATARQAARRLKWGNARVGRRGKSATPICSSTVASRARWASSHTRTATTSSRSHRASHRAASDNRIRLQPLAIQVDPRRRCDCSPPARRNERTTKHTKRTRKQAMTCTFFVHFADFVVQNRTGLQARRWRSSPSAPRPASTSADGSGIAVKDTSSMKTVPVFVGFGSPPNVWIA